MKKPKDDMRAAFPHSMELSPDGEVMDGGDAGMTLRQWYAGQALPAVIQCDDGALLRPSEVAQESVQYADALIAELDKESE